MWQSSTLLPVHLLALPSPDIVLLVIPTKCLRCLGRLRLEDLARGSGERCLRGDLFRLLLLFLGIEVFITIILGL